MKKSLALVLGLLGTITAATEAIANADIIKTVERGRNVIYVKGLTPSTPIQLSAGSNRATAILANSCGIIRVRQNQVPANNVMTINGTNYSTSDPDVISEAPVCNGANPPWTGTNPRKDAQNNFYFSGFTANAAATVLVASNENRSATANRCGIARFRDSESNPWPSNFSFSIGGNSYNLSTVTSQTYPPYCRNLGTGDAPIPVLYEAVTP
jgi:hypothetical protein